MKLYKKLIPAPIDNKNLLEDGFEDEMFKDFYIGRDHGTGGLRHLMGSVETECYDAMVDVRWYFGDFQIMIQVLGFKPSEDYDLVSDEVYDYYEREFKNWQCEDNPGLVVKTCRMSGILTVCFYFDWSEDN